ncbi:hypothetical protein H0B56_01990 [Haloechinothrix sp. YIM 98757]|uniref:Secreted protein n=1 Tax=Haloechinothrix aidingensis TaxID=2752311 RepID=A0A838A763_9PSEU|nr:hypothetical protein [Haloechinothrix aidingensis]MBA0124307.1 hypothetical protein [Haloechinothrix aidingensis]
MHHRIPATLVITAVLALASAAVSPVHGSEHAEGRDSAVGAGTSTFPVTGGPISFAFAAHSDPSGAAPGGYFRSETDVDGDDPIEPFTVQGEVTCLRVDGDRASFKYRFDRTAGSAEPFDGGGIQIFVEDNGKPRGGEPVDAMTFDPPQPAGVYDLRATQCDDPNTRVTYERIDSGNITVRDAEPE